MKEIRLYGALGKKFGKSFRLAVETPAEAFRALKAIVPGFKEYILKNNEPGYHIFLGKVDIDTQELTMTTSSEVIKIVPATIGSGGIFKVILGALIAYFVPGGQKIGISLMLSGISEILFAPPKQKGIGTNEKPDNAPSYIFNGAVNTVAQGNPVPLCYGRMKVGSQVISAGMSAREIPISTPATTTIGKFTTTI